MSERTWWPSEWADEVMPPGRDSPDKFIVASEGQYWLGYPLDADDVGEREKRELSRKIVPGDIVNFMCCDDYGQVVVTISPDGAYRVDGDVPESATHFSICGDPDTLSFSLADLVENLIQVEGELTRAETFVVGMAHWSADIPHKFVVSYAPGDLRFEQVTAAEATQ